MKANDIFIKVKGIEVIRFYNGDDSLSLHSEQSANPANRYRSKKLKAALDLEIEHWEIDIDEKRLTFILKGE